MQGVLKPSEQGLLLEEEGIVTVFFHESSIPHLVDIDTVRPNPENENGNDTDAIVESIATSGFYGAVIADQDGMLIAGHGRYAALQELGVDQIPVLFVEATAEQAARIRIADNRTTRLGRDDPALMEKTLTELLSTDLGLQGTGYQADDLEYLRASLDEPLTFDEEEFAKQNTGHVCECPECGWTSSKK